MRILLTAPRTDLTLADAEVQAIIRSGLDVTPLLGDVRHVDFVRDVQADDYDVLWLCTHGTSEGVHLSDGILSASMLTPLVRDRFDVVILNTCESVQTAIMLQNETGAEVICTVEVVPDIAAYQTGALLARSLADTGDLETAYNASRPGGNRTYLRLAGKKK